MSVSEETVAFGPGGVLVGTICLPDARARRASVGAVLLNAGVVHRIGPHRINVRLARQLADRGIPSIRFDLSGQGDSARPASAVGFEAQAVKDLSSAMDALSLAAGLHRFSIFGFCSGGYHAYAVAQSDERVAGLVIYDTFIYRTLRSRLNRYARSIRRQGMATALKRWIARQAHALARRLNPAGGAEADVRAPFDTEGLPKPSVAAFAAVAKQLHRRGTSIVMMYSGGFEDFNYAEQFRDAFRAHDLSALVTCDYFPMIGHLATALAEQRILVDRVVEWTCDLDERLHRGAGGG